jgi:hypothetical protein
MAAMSERQGVVVRNGLLAGGAFVIVMLLVLFYSTVSGAVDRAARHRADGVGGARSTAPSGVAPAQRSVDSLDRSGS